MLTLITQIKILTHTRKKKIMPRRRAYFLRTSGTLAISHEILTRMMTRDSVAKKGANRRAVYHTHHAPGYGTVVCSTIP